MAVTREDKSVLHQWFGPNRGTHWTIAGSVALIILGSYFIYSNNRDTPPPAAPTVSATDGAAAPTAPAPLPPAPEKAK